MEPTTLDQELARSIAARIGQQELADMNEWERWIAQAIADERERCAKIMDASGEEHYAGLIRAGDEETAR